MDAGNWDSLAAQLSAFGLSPTEFDGMRTELDQAKALKSNVEKSALAGTWIGRLVAKVVEGSSGVGIEAAASGIAKVIAAYLGISGA